MARRRRRRPTPTTDDVRDDRSYTDPSATQEIGSLNGWWSLLLRLVLVTTPVAWTVFITLDLPWRIWVTRELFRSGTHIEKTSDLGTKLDAILQQQRLDYRSIQEQLAKQPPTEWRDRVQHLEAFDRINRADHAKILISLEAIKAKLGLPAQVLPGSSYFQAPEQPTGYLPKPSNEEPPDATPIPRDGPNGNP